MSNSAKRVLCKHCKWYEETTDQVVGRTWSECTHPQNYKKEWSGIDGYHKVAIESPGVRNASGDCPLFKRRLGWIIAVSAFVGFCSGGVLFPKSFEVAIFAGILLPIIVAVIVRSLD